MYPKLNFQAFLLKNKNVFIHKWIKTKKIYTYKNSTKIAKVFKTIILLSISSQANAL